MVRLTWSKERVRRGGQPQGAVLRCDGKDVGHAGASRTGWDSWSGWYWAVATDAELGVQHRNTAHAPAETLEQAKAECLAYVRKCMARKAGA